VQENFAKNGNKIHVAIFPCSVWKQPETY